jgi:amino acid permease
LIDSKHHPDIGSLCSIDQFKTPSGYGQFMLDCSFWQPFSSFSSYSTIAWIAPLVVDPAKDLIGCHDKGRDAFKVLNALGQMAFAYAGHNVVLEIQATIPSIPSRPSKIPMWKGVILAYMIVALCYFPVALVGLFKFSNNIDDNILMSLENPRALIAVANMMVFIHVVGSYQVLEISAQTR